MNRGILYAIGAYSLWGVLPIYWKNLQSVPPLEIMAHRVIWCCFLMAGLLTLRHRWSWLKPALRNKRIMTTFIATGIILALNWSIYIWAINTGKIVESSLGYFINPLLSVVLGILFLGEHLRRGQMVAILMAVAGVAYLTFGYGEFPWVALSLAFTFGTYGLLRKTAPLEAREGLTLEMSVLLLPSLLFLIFARTQGEGAFLNSDPRTSLLLIGSGLVTAGPLLLFGLAARRITLTNVGLLQYIAPTLQFLIGIFVYQEAFSQERFFGFAIIWLGLLIYALEGLMRSRKQHNARLKARALPGDI